MNTLCFLLSSPSLLVPIPSKTRTFHLPRDSLDTQTRLGASLVLQRHLWEKQVQQQQTRREREKLSTLNAYVPANRQRGGEGETLIRYKDVT